MTTRQAEVTIPLEDVLSAIQSDDSVGFCLACGEEAYGCEPDARNYKCESCGERRVFGAEEVLIMGATTEPTDGPETVATRDDDAVTPTVADPSNVPADYLTVRLPAHDLARILHNASLFTAPKDSPRPILGCVNISVSITDGTVTATGTDSYVMGQDSAAIEPNASAQPDRSWLLPAADLAPVIKALSRRDAGEATVTLADPTRRTDTESSVTFAASGATFAVRSYPGDFPNTSAIITAAEDATPELPNGSITINPRALAVLAKVRKMDGKPCQPLGSGERGMTFRFSTDRRPVHITIPEHGSRFLALVMPVRPS